MRYRGNVCVTIDPDVLQAFDDVVFCEMHTTRSRSKTIEAMMLRHIERYGRRETGRALRRKLIRQQFSRGCGGDLIVPRENRDVPDSQAFGILTGSRSGQACDEDRTSG